MSMKRERWLRTSCPVSDPEHTGVRREYENARQTERLARYYRRTGEGDWTERMEADARERLRRMENARSKSCACVAL